MRRIACRLLGHGAPATAERIVRGQYVRASICPRCMHLFSFETGRRADRRAAWRDRLRDVA